MIEYAMLAALGFFVASLVAVLFAGPFWNRAVRLTRKRMEATMPMSLADIRAERDHLRAQYVVEIRRLEIAHDREKERAARFLIERNKAKVEITELKTRLKKLEAELAERGNESTVLEQTVRKRIPDLEQQLERARQIIAARDRELARATTAYQNQTEALGAAKKVAGRYSEEIERLRAALESGGAALRRGGLSEDALAAENQRLQAELSHMRQQVERVAVMEAEENAALRREIQSLSEQLMRGAPPRVELEASPAETETIVLDGGGEEADADGGARSAEGRGGRDGGTSLGERLKKLAERATA